MDSTLRARLRAGDREALGELFDLHASDVNRYATRVLGNRAAAEDIVSLTFIEAWRLRAKVTPDGDSLRPWLLAVATNLMRNAARAARRHDAALGRLPVNDITPDFSDDVVDRVADTAEALAARLAFSRLGRHERDVVALCVWAELTYQDAARALGIPVGTVRSRLSRARDKLRHTIAAELAKAAQEEAAHDSPLRIAANIDLGSTA